MKRLYASGQFKMDYNRYRNQPRKQIALKFVHNLLQNELPIPENFRPHMLHGEYKGCMECLNPAIE